MFNPRNQKPNDHISILDPVTTSDYSYNLRNWPKNDVERVQFRVQESLNHVNYGDESGVSSPPLWKNSHQISTNYRSHSNSSRALAITRGQFELMEMVKNMPESCYELSLKDLVEQNTVLESEQEECLINKVEENFTSTTSPEQVVVQQRVKSIQRQESNSNENKKGKMIRNESFENQRLFLKMFFPISLESKKKQNKYSPKTTTKVSPKPAEGLDKSSKSVEKDWWKRRFSCSSESDSSRTSSSNSESSGSSGNNNTSSRRNTNRKKKGFLSSCWSAE
ncbi:uncharacterized protein LOC107768794 [Nicotiana tabacum]|uniref:Uncharacterized protein LOC107768794 n=2 Tax=Nicotiana TaxID=4085 RepID=A0A1S3XU81_TOBAC|nr:PREDICTED: uncharacterized protein LOC104231884 [Nicotiana sylvestris]XP_016443430.1 PREDICTED: uncharacterized protein LOC107768794 [Nicotiana tabacum]